MITLRVWMADRLRKLEYWLVPPPAPPNRLEGKWCQFALAGKYQGEPRWQIFSRRGGFTMGEIRWSSTWRAYYFHGDPEVTYNGGSLAEIYAFLKERGQVTGRFV